MSAKLGRLSVAAYAAPTIPESIASIAIVVVIPGYYTSVLGVPAALVGIALLASRCLDAVLDPLIGYISDRTRSRLWGRKPMVLAGALLFSLGAYALLAPPARVDAVYLGLWSFIFYFGWTVYSVPYDAWGVELSAAAEARSRIFTWRAGFFYIGMAAFFIAPLLPGRASTMMDAQSMTQSAVAIAVLAPALTLAALWLTPSGAPHAGPRDNLAGVAGSLLRNKPLRLYLINALISGLGNGMNVSLAYLFMAEYLDLGSAFSIILLANILANLVALPLWRAVILRLGKTRTWALALFLNALLLPAYLLAPPDDSGFWIVLIVASLSGATYSACNVLLPSILGDIVDYEQWRTKHARAGSFFAVYALVRKLNNALGASAAFLIVAAFGYQTGRIEPGMQSLGLMVAFVALPVVLQLISAIMALTFPINERRHDIVRKRLQRQQPLEEREPAHAAPG
ncbi:MAG: MFS transporter [Parvularculaceae bacterium]